jgi:hypothetical protein
MRRLLPLFSIGLLFTAAPACDRSTDLAGMSEEAFVSAMASLRRIDRDAALDSAAKTTARESTLQERNLTSAQLEAAARALARDPEHAVGVWSRIDSLAREEAVTDPAEAP